MRTRSLAAIVALALASPCLAQSEEDVRALGAVFERPEGQRIGEAEKERLRAFLAAREGQELGRLGYARAMMSYLERDTAAAVKTLLAWLDEGHLAEGAADPFAGAEHRSVCGRILLGEVASKKSAETFDAAALERSLAPLGQLYPDREIVLRVAAPAIFAAPEADQPRLKLALALGMLRSGGPAEEVNDAVRRLLAMDAATAARAAAPAAAPRRPESELAGKPGPAFEALHVIGGGAAKSLADLRGKPVLIDFSATWCTPCRKLIPTLVELEKEHGEAVQFLTVTRLYGYGVDFKGGDREAGERVEGLSEEAEVAINRAFHATFALDNPLWIVDRAVSASYGVSGIPTVVVLDANGVVVGTVVGAPAGVRDAISALIVKAKGGAR